MYAKWVQSWRDLPVLINQWANVVRWEKVTRPFLRTTEFLWQEGHTAHETEAEAQEETLKILGLYKEFVETELAMPVVDGQKSESEKFAGASRTYSIEALMGDGRALQAGTSHNLGQNFAKAFEIKFQARDKTVQHAWTTSWGVSTRLIGGVIMTHGDDSGLILPPRVAPYQVVIVPIPRGNWQETVLPKAREIQAELVRQGVRVMLDDRDAYTPGWKFAEWEMRGVPLRLEIGPKDIEKSQVMLARRDTREKLPTPMDGLAGAVVRLLDEIQKALYDRALKFREEHTQRVGTYDEFKAVMEGRPGFVIAGWCGSADCEAQIKAGNPGHRAEHPVRRREGRRHVREVRAAGRRRGLVREGVLVAGCRSYAGPVEHARAVRPARLDPLHDGVPARHLVAPADRAERLGQLMAPARVLLGRSRVRRRQRLQARHVADDVQRGEKRDRHRAARLRDRLAQVVQRDPAFPQRQRLVERAPHRLPFGPPAVHAHRSFVHAQRVDHLLQRAQRGCLRPALCDIAQDAGRVRKPPFERVPPHGLGGRGVARHVDRACLESGIGIVLHSSAQQTRAGDPLSTPSRKERAPGTPSSAAATRARMPSGMSWSASSDASRTRCSAAGSSAAATSTSRASVPVCPCGESSSPRSAAAATTARSPPSVMASRAMTAVRRSPTGSSARRIAIFSPRSRAAPYAAINRSTARGPMTASRAIAASRRTSSSPPSAATSCRISAAADALMTMDSE